MLRTVKESLSEEALKRLENDGLVFGKSVRRA
jgi:hypothetical protein